jgi:hypothetical protein
MKPDEDRVREGDNVENLYIGYIPKLVAVIDDKEINFGGEMLFYGQSEGDDFVVEELRRLALVGRSPDPEDGLGVIALAGPVQIAELAPGPEGRAETLLMELSYQALSNLDAPERAADVEFPRVELFATDMNWAWRRDGALAESQVGLRLDFEHTRVEFRDGDLEPVIDQFALEPVDVSYDLAGTGEEPVSSAKHNSLQVTECLQDTVRPPCGQDLETVVRQVPIRFVNVSSKRSWQLERVCEKQINTLCEVWWSKAVLNVVVEPDIEDRSAQLSRFKNISALQQQKELSTEYERLNPSSSNVVEVFLVDKLDFDDVDGAVCLDAGKGRAFCILEEGKLPQPGVVHTRDFLLAHEMGHVLGITHPSGKPPIFYPGPGGRPKNYIGSSNSVLDPAASAGGLEKHTP